MYLLKKNVNYYMQILFLSYVSLPGKQSARKEIGENPNKIKSHGGLENLRKCSDFPNGK